MGIDVGKAGLGVAIDGRQGVLRFADIAAGIRKLVRQLASLPGARVAGGGRGDTRTGCWRPAATPGRQLAARTIAA